MWWDIDSRILNDCVKRISKERGRSKVYRMCQDKTGLKPQR